MSKGPSALRLEKSPSGIKGFDEITNGGLPRGRTSLVCGGPGCGKTVFAMEFLVHGVEALGEPGLFVSFDEEVDELVQNFASFDVDLTGLQETGRLRLEAVRIERAELEVVGHYDLEGLLIRLAHAIDQVGARRVVVDGLDHLFASLNEQALLRSEVRRLFRWLKERGVTTLATAELGNGQLTRSGVEEYLSDCVLRLDHRVTEQLSTRRLRVVKYRGSAHGADEYPFLIGERGIIVFPITSAELEYAATTERVSTGVADLDGMLGGLGYYRGTSVLLSGPAGTGKTSLAAHFVDAATRRGERALYFAFEESRDQLLRNMRSIGIDLDQAFEAGLLRFIAVRPSKRGLEPHLLALLAAIESHAPDVVVVDPISNLTAVGSQFAVHSMLTRLLDLLKRRKITSVFNVLEDSDAPPGSVVGVSSLMDTWIVLRDVTRGDTREHLLYVLKSRGMSHSNRDRRLQFTEHGVRLISLERRSRREAPPAAGSES